VEGGKGNFSKLGIDKKREGLEASSRSRWKKKLTNPVKRRSGECGLKIRDHEKGKRTAKGIDAWVRNGSNVSGLSTAKPDIGDFVIKFESVWRPTPGNTRSNCPRKPVRTGESDQGNFNFVKVLTRVRRAFGGQIARKGGGSVQHGGDRETKKNLIPGGGAL